MKAKMSKDFQKNFWLKFDQEFGSSTGKGRVFLAPAFALTILIALFFVQHNKVPKYDPVAVRIAIETDETVSDIFDMQDIDGDSSYLFESEQLI